MDQGKFVKRNARVTLHVYDLGPSFAGPNMVGRAIGTGAFHAGVEVYGVEWSFSCGQEGPYRSGIFAVRPKGCDGHVYREPVEMGETSLSQREVRALIEQMHKEWPGADYDLLRHNCCHFSDTFCAKLGVGNIPTWITSLAGVGAMLRSGVRIGLDAVYDAPNFFAGAFGAVAKVVALDSTAEEDPSADKQPPLKKGQVLMKVGEDVEVWSNTHQVWCPGRVESVKDNGFMDVTFRLPKEKDRMATKSLPQGHSQVRKATKLAEHAGAFAQGDAVEVWSNSAQAWCRGTVESVTDGMLRLEFRLPGAKPNELSEKQLPQGHKDVRRVDPKHAASPALVPEVPVHSSVIAEADQKAREAAARRLAAAVKDKNPVDIEEACGAAETAGVSDAEIAEARMKAVLFAAQEELAAAVASEDAVWIEQACRRASDADVSGAEVDAARAVAGALNARVDLDAAAMSGDAELVEEACKFAKSAGVSDSVLDAARSKAKSVREAEETHRAEESQKDRESGKFLPLKRGTSQESDMMPLSTMVILPHVGDWVEVYSNTNQAWCLGRITKVTSDGTVVAFQLPGAKAEDWHEKMVLNPQASSVLRRLPATPSGASRNVAQSPVAIIPGIVEDADMTWSNEEQSAYGHAFRSLLRGSDGSIPQDRAAEFLRASGLSRKVLKQIWLVANPAGCYELGHTEFSACLRLTGHCQALLGANSKLATSLLVDGSEELQGRLREDFLHRPAEPLPRFHGHILECPVNRQVSGGSGFEIEV